MNAIRNEKSSKLAGKILGFLARTILVLQKQKKANKFLLSAVPKYFPKWPLETILFLLIETWPLANVVRHPPIINVTMMEDGLSMDKKLLKMLSHHCRHEWVSVAIPITPDNSV